MSGTTPKQSKELFQPRKDGVKSKGSNGGIRDENSRPGRKLSWNSLRASHSREYKEPSAVYERKLSWDGQSNASIPLSQASIPLSRLPSSSNMAPPQVPIAPSSVKEIPISFPHVQKHSKSNLAAVSSNNNVQIQRVLSGENGVISCSTDSDEEFNYQLLRQSSYYQTNDFLHQKKLIDMHNAQVTISWLRSFN